MGDLRTGAPNGGEPPLLLTRQGQERLEAELAELGRQRGLISDQIRQCRELGEPGENAELDGAKQAQALLEFRLTALRRVLARAEPLRPELVPKDQVAIGSLVLLLDEESDEEWQALLVSSVEADPEADRISVECPLGQAMLGRVAGDRVEIETPGGRAFHAILAIETPDDL